MKVACVISSTKLVADVTAAIKEQGHEVVTCQAMKAAMRSKAQLIFAEWTEGPLLAQLVRDLHGAGGNAVPVVVLVPAGAVTTMHRALAAGAADVLFCPVVAQEIRAEIEEIGSSETGFDPASRDAFDELRRDMLVGESADFLKCLDEMRRAARCDANILLCGETGTGKEMLARGVHRLSRRSGSAYVPVHCASFPSSLLESELFGHVKGAFTDAKDDRKGRFEEVGAGTLLLDEVGDIELPLQTKLLRVIEAREFSRLGENKTRPFHGRLICATSVDFDQAVAQGRFRADLLGRIRQFSITLLPLRQRSSDVPILVWHFIEKHAHGRRVEISRSALELLRHYDFPRNVRQLENAIVEALARSDPATLILPKHLPNEITAHEASTSQDGSQTIRIPQGLAYSEAREWVCRKFDRIALGALLRKYHNNQSRAAEEAGVDRKTFSARVVDALESQVDDPHA